MHQCILQKLGSLFASPEREKKEGKRKRHKKNLLRKSLQIRFNLGFLQVSTVVSATNKGHFPDKYTEQKQQYKLDSRKHQKSTTASEDKSKIDKENTYSPDNEATPDDCSGGNGAGNRRIKGLTERIEGIGDS